MRFGWQTEKDVILTRAKVSPMKKLEAIRLMNEFADKVLTKRQKILRRKIRESQ